MLSRGNGDKFHIDIDLTSMLDVIFIILMVVMCRQLLSNARDAKTLQETQAELEAVQADNKLYEMRLHDLENPEEGLARVTLYANYESTSPKIRHLRLMIGDSPAINDMVMMADTEEQVYSDFTAGLKAFIAENAEANIPVLLTLDEGNILYRDHLRVESILAELKDEFGNLYIRPFEGGD